MTTSRRTPPRRPLRNRRGVALLEALVAMTILAAAGAALVALASQSAAAVRHARVAEEESGAASGFLDAVALWPREELDLRLGTRPQGPWLMHLERAWPTIYVVSLRDSSGRELLRTSLYRPAPAPGAR